MTQNKRYVVLKQGNVALVVDKLGAQIVSYKINGVELMYQGALDPEHNKWKKSAPVLFPNPGPVTSEALYQIRDIDGNLMFEENGEAIYGVQHLPSVVIGVDSKGNKKDFYVKEAKIDGKSELIYVNEKGDALDDVDITFNEDGTTLITLNNNNITYKIDKKPVVFRKLKYNNESYFLAQHGFIQATEFKVLGNTGNSCVLGTWSDDSTRKSYPYNFNFAAVYGLEDKGKLDVTFAAINKGDKAMPGGIGWHPAFNLHDEAGKYKLVLENVDGDPVFEDKKKNITKISEGEELDINSLIVGPQVSGKIKGINSADVKLIYYPHNGAEPVNYLSMHVNDNLVLWTAKGESNMIAIEPWGTDSRQVGTAESQAGLEDQENISLIKPGETKELKTNIAINKQYLQLIKQMQSVAARKAR